MQRRVLFRTTGVTADQMQRRHRNIQFGVVGVGQHQVLIFDAARFQRGHAGIAPDAMLRVHHRLTIVQLGEVADQRVRVDGTTRVLTAAGNALAQQIAFANQHPVAQRIDKAMFGRANHQPATRAGGLVKTQDPFGCNLNTRQQFN